MVFIGFLSHMAPTRNGAMQSVINGLFYEMPAKATIIIVGMNFAFTISRLTIPTSV